MREDTLHIFPNFQTIPHASTADREDSVISPNVVKSARGVRGDATHTSAHSPSALAVRGAVPHRRSSPDSSWAAAGDRRSDVHEPFPKKQTKKSPIPWKVTQRSDRGRKLWAEAGSRVVQLAAALCWRLRGDTLAFASAAACRATAALAGGHRSARR